MILFVVSFPLLAITQSLVAQEGREAMKAAARKTGKGHIIETVSKLNPGTAEAGKKIGSDVQVSDDSNTRSRMMKWNDDSNNSYQDASRLGTSKFTAAATPAI